MPSLISFLFTLLLLGSEIIQLQTRDLEERKQEACSRGPHITAASRAENLTKFYVYEKQHAWLYNAEDKVLEDYIDLTQKLAGDTIVFAAGELFCNDSILLLFTEKMAYGFKDINDLASWQDRRRSELQNLKGLYNVDTKGHEIEDIIAVGAACSRVGPNSKILTLYLYFEDNKVLYCLIYWGCREKDMGVYHPFKFNILKATKKSVDALAFEYDTNQENVGVLFVSESTLYYWREDNVGSPWSEITLSELFGCTSYAMVFAIIGGSLVVIGLVLTTTVVVLLVKRKRSNSKQRTLTATSTTSKANPSEPLTTE